MLIYTVNGVVQGVWAVKSMGMCLGLFHSGTAQLPPLPKTCPLFAGKRGSMMKDQQGFILKFLGIRHGAFK